MALETKEVTPEDLSKAKKSDTIITKCPSCGGNMIYNPDKNGLECEYCGYTVEVSKDKISQEISLDKIFEGNQNEWGDETHVFRCNNCGATQILSRKEISKKCSFCGTTNVVETDDVSGLKPNAVLPFIISKEVACQNVVVWAKKKFFAPKAFKKSIEPEDTFGNFYPSFTFDSQTFSRYEGELGEYYYETVRRNGKTERIRKVRWFRVSGTNVAAFDDILIQALTNASTKYVDKIRPFDTNNSNEYSTNFLQGYSASQYTKNGQQCWDEAKGVMDRQIRNQILSKHHHDTVRYLNVDTTYSNSTYKYVLLPVYVGHCTYTQKLYNFYVNGQTGKVAGKTPISALKVTILVIIILILVAAAVAAYLLMGGKE